MAAVYCVMPECNGEPGEAIHGGLNRCALARGRMYSCGSNGKLEADFQFILNLFGDFVQIAWTFNVWLFRAYVLKG
jgi:hypothetical protein